jgi:hypothetical protein
VPCRHLCTGGAEVRWHISVVFVVYHLVLFSQVNQESLRYAGLAAIVLERNAYAVWCEYFIVLRYVEHKTQGGQGQNMRQRCRNSNGL